ncbi:MAG: type II secretion system protein [Pseudomonadales bacterium]|nr:type II secretion system protein [Pseudomonadales bacterium]
MNISSQKGVTLVELVMAIAIAGIGLVALLNTFSSLVGRSADPMITQQSIAIAESFVEEVTAQAFLDPSTSTVCPAAPASRSDFNNVCDYNGYSSSSITDVAGNSLGLSSYQVTVAVNNGASVTGHLGAISGSDILQIVVTVVNPLGENVTLSGYRVRY